MIEFEGGALREERCPLYHMIPGCAVRVVAERFAAGGEKYDPGVNERFYPDQNWQRGDEAYYVDVANHAMQHFLLWLDGDRSENHLGAILWAFCVLVWATSKGRIE